MSRIIIRYIEILVLFNKDKNFLLSSRTFSELKLSSKVGKFVEGKTQ